MIFSRLVFFSGLLFCFSNEILGQDTIRILNPSFEDNPHQGASNPPTSIFFWHNCDDPIFPINSPPDILPTPEYLWGVEVKPIDGHSYLGLVTRADGSSESVSQKLKPGFVANKCYKLEAYLCLSKTFNGRTNTSPDGTENFAHPVTFNLWGGNTTCERKSLLAESSPIDNFKWQLYTFEFSPEENFRFITIEAYFVKGTKEPYYGHILIDGLSPIIEISCD